MIISLSGERQVGKDTVGDILVRKYDYIKVGWADAIRDIITSTLPLTLENLLDPYQKDTEFSKWANFDLLSIDSVSAYKIVNKISELYPKELPKGLVAELKGQQFTSIRSFMQWFGTDFCRKLIDDDIWIKILLNKINDNENFVITDSRFSNERNIVKGLNEGILIRIHRDTGLTNTGHSSENDLGDDSEYDVVIHNDSNIAVLSENVSLWHELKYKHIKRN